jgi:hypothetical protein
MDKKIIADEQNVVTADSTAQAVTENTNSNEKRKYYISKQDWMNFRFFTCTDEVKEATLSLLTERKYLHSDGTPNEEEITKEANFFANSLAQRFVENRYVRRIGALTLIRSIRKFTEKEDLSALYFYVMNIYGTRI